MTENEIPKIVEDAAITVYRQLYPGILESSYTECLYYELVQRELNVRKEVSLPLVYKEVQLDCGYRVDK